MTTTKPRKLSEDDIAKAAQEYEGGKTVRALAADYGVSYGGMHRILTSANVTMRSRGGNTKAGAR